MSEILNTAEATTDDTTVATEENTSVETATDTNIVLELTAEQLADREKVNTINNTIEKAGKQFKIGRAHV